MLPTIRTFIAIELNERIKRELALIQKRLKSADTPPAPEANQIAWVKPEHMHLTLKFLGDVDPKKVETLETILSDTTNDFGMFHMDIGTLGAFPNTANPRVIWAGITKRANLLTDISARLEEGLTAQGFQAAEHAFTPHITLGRSRNDRPHEALSQSLKNIHLPAGLSQKIERICLFRSELLPKGPIYHLLYSANLHRNT